MQQTIQYGLVAALLLGLGAVAGATTMSAGMPLHPMNLLSDHDAQEPAGESPYAGQQTREISYLPSEDVTALEQGKGGALGGLAKPAELNSYPGPRHVLDLADDLNLTDDQEQQIRLLFEEMQAEVRPVGQEFLEVERKIDEGYAQGTLTDDELQRLLERSGDLYGELRYVHLRYHFQTKDILTEGQVQHYDELRGYTADDSMQHSGGSHAH